MKNEKRDKIKSDFKLLFNNLKLTNSSNNEHKIFFNLNNTNKKLSNENSEDLDYIPLNSNFKDYYKIISVLGQGTLGVVKKAIDVKTGDIVAVKIINSRDEEIVFQIKNEFLNLKKIDHINIIKVKQLLIDNMKAKVYMIMEYFECVEMFDYIVEKGQYTEENAKFLFLQLMKGIEYLHENGVIHRDLKPNNILVSKCGKLLKITDFNIAKFSKEYNNFNDLSHENFNMSTYTGTIAFNAPEIFENNGYYTEAVDSWSAGCVLFTMLVGKQPFNKE